jgi:hypothetical protein
VASFDGLVPIGPDACLSDPSAPCYYLHLKRRALNGERTKLSRRELELVGVGVTPPSERGWRNPSGLYLDEWDTAADPVLQALASVGASRLEFLG